MWVFYLNVVNVVGAYRFSMNWTIGFGSFLIRLNVVVYFFLNENVKQSLAGFAPRERSFLFQEKRSFPGPRRGGGGGEGMKTNFPSTISLRYTVGYRQQTGPVSLI